LAALGKAHRLADGQARRQTGGGGGRPKRGRVCSQNQLQSYGWRAR